MKQMARQHRLSVALLVLSAIILPVAILTFAAGFFPHKPFLPGTNHFGPGQDERPRPLFDKVIFMVVDALRSDFVYSNESSFHFVQSLIKTGAAIPFTAHATSPTITMPRVKAITTGSIPSFLDVILNFAESDTTSTLANQDTWPSQLQKKPDGKKLVMYGDDTWLKLFPHTFSRSDGTSSFFVSDFTEVDNNVTRHVSPELDNTDWNGLIMHYLGLDHIGHKSGPRSPHMAPKQREMDGIVHQIYKAIETQKHLNRSLLVLCGDHGMNDAGNHGGSAPGETSPALVFMSPMFQTLSGGLDSPAASPRDDFQYYDLVEQSDIAPTLAGLLGFPVPRNNLGVFIPRMLELWPEESQIQLLHRNAEQVLSILRHTFRDTSFDGEPSVKSCLGPDTAAMELHCLWARSRSLHSKADIGGEQIKGALLQFLLRSQSIMSSTASNYDVTKLQGGTLLSFASTCIAAAALFSSGRFSGANALLGFMLTVGYGTTMFASSFVEEEHHFWYWLGSGWLGWLYATNFARGALNPKTKAWLTLILMGSFRVVRRWNQTGQKHAGAADIGRTFLSGHSTFLWGLVAITFIGMGYQLATRGLPRASRQVSTLAALAICLSAFGFKLAFTIADAPELLRGIPAGWLELLGDLSLVGQARAVFLGLGLSALYVASQRYIIFHSRPLIKSQHSTSGIRDVRLGVADDARALHDLLTIFVVTQTRVNNIPLFLIFFCQLRILSTLDLRPDEITLTCSVFQYASFFALGGSNAISSVDLSSAYNGIQSYNVIAVGILTFVGNWAGPVWWSSGAILLLSRHRDINGQELVRHFSLLTLLAASSLVFVMAACTLLRTHLFIWTVFSPKYLYSMAWSLGQHLCINIGLGAFLWQVGSK